MGGASDECRLMAKPCRFDPRADVGDGSVLLLQALRGSAYLTRGEGFDAPQEVRHVLDGHLKAEGIR